MNPAQDMGTQERKKIEQGVKRWMDTGHPAADGWGQGQLPANNLSAWKKLKNRASRYVSYLRTLMGVVEKVIAEDHPPVESR
jgi:hypothetical protein